jgi:hypothetical protein
MPPDEEQNAPAEEEPVIRMGGVIGKVRRCAVEKVSGGPKGEDRITTPKRSVYLTAWDSRQGGEVVYPDRRDQLPQRLAGHTLHTQDFPVVGMDTPDLAALFDDPNAVNSWQTARRTRAAKPFWGHPSE